MGISRSFRVFLFMIAFALGATSFAGLNSSVDDESSSSSGGGINLETDLQLPGSNTNNEGSGIQTSTDCSSSMSDSSSHGSTCWGITPEPEVPRPTPAPRDGKNGNASNDKKNDGKSGSTSKDNAEQEAAESAAALCRSQYQSARQSCEGAISSTGGTCDSSSDIELNAAAAAAGKSQNTNSMIQLACSEAGGVSNSAKTALSGFRKRCSSAVESCRSSCATLTSFLQNNSSCYSALGLTSTSAQSLAQSKSATCEGYRGQVSEADRAISSYGTTSAGAAACQMATLGGQSVGSSTTTPAFCQANPSYPGCAGAARVDCNDPSQASNKICVCSKNPNNALCVGTPTADSSSSFGGGSNIDSSSRLPAAANVAGGDIPTTPGVRHAERSSSGNAEGVDGRQGGAAVGESTVGNGLGPQNINSGASAEEEIFISRGFMGGRGGNTAMLRSVKSDEEGSPPGVTGPSVDGKNQMPDLRKFLPGGGFDPRAYSGLTGSVRIGIDGITGPHSNIWKKIQNRYQIIQGTLEP